MELEQPAAAAGIDTFALKKRQHQAFVSARLVLVSAFISLWPLMFLIATGGLRRRRSRSVRRRLSR